MKINSQAYWNKKFKSGEWFYNQGFDQTDYFAQILLDNLSKDIIEDINKNKYLVIDYACATGQLTNKFKEKFPSCNVKGIDISEEAIKVATSLFPILEFKQGEVIDNCDICICSNILEHISNNIDIMSKLLNKTNKHMFILVPYKEDPQNLIPEHFHSFDENNFPDYFNGFKKIFEKIIDVRESGFWYGDQLLIIYSKDVSNGYI